MKTINTLLFLIFGCFVFGQMTPTQVTQIPMRDGKFLAADVYVPSNCTDCPTILIQTPYNKNLFRMGLPLGTGQNFQASNYVFVVVDWRGFYGSAAASVPQANRGEDGYDVIEWISDQAWSNQKVGTWGPSALGVIQYQTAREQHPNHICAVPIVAHPTTSYESYYYGGVLEKARLEQLDNLGYGLSPTVLANPYKNTTWQFAGSNSWYPSDIEIPTLQIGGWYDHNIDIMIDWYKATRTSAAAAVQNQQYLLVGPWVHGGFGTANVGSGVQGELAYPDAAFKSDSMARDFFSHYLRNANPNWVNTPKITYYQMGKNQWNSSNANSIEMTENGTLLLNASNKLSTNVGSGISSMTVDPKNPSPTIGGHTLHPDLDQGPYNQNSLDARNDVITFETDALFSDVTISGRVKAKLFVSSNQPDGDLVVRVTDEYPDGRSMLINDGIHRIRLRNGFAQANESFMTNGQVYEVNVTLPFTHYTWKTGHKIKIYISGNSSYRWDVNLQNGGPMYTSGDTNTAVMNIHHTSQFSSQITLPGDDLTLSTTELTDSEFISIFPNPATNHISIKGVNPGARITIYSLLGQPVLEEEIENEVIDIHHLKSGMYWIAVEGISVRKSFVKLD